MDNSILVLLIEDEPLIHDVLGEAIEMIEAPDAAYRALVTDIDLGSRQKTGWNIAKRAREINADLPVIYMTGKSAHEWASNGVPNSIMLTKPFAPAQLIAAVSQLLNQAQI